jgi:hypothetical protein
MQKQFSFHLPALFPAVFRPREMKHGLEAGMRMFTQTVTKMMQDPSQTQQL